MGVLRKILGVGMDVTHYTINSPKIPPAFSGFKIVHLSDFHCKPKKNITSYVKNEKPDVIFMTGDMLDERLPCDSFLELLDDMIKIAPTYIISGNHDVLREDYDILVGKCRSMGAIYLRDQSVDIERDGEKITIHGIEDTGSKDKDEVNNGIICSLKKLKRCDGYEILLFHRANKLNVFKGEKFDLILSGHMHGGQIRLPKVGGVLAPRSSLGGDESMFFPKFTGGRYKVGETDAIVSRGMGNSVPLPRFGNPTEIICIELMQKE